jgi:GH43 family beta-xylosidase
MLAIYVILWIVTLIFPTFIQATDFSNATSLAPTQFTNPLRQKDGSDPFMVHTAGYYYMMTTTWKDVQLTRSKTIEGLKNGEKRVVYQDSSPNRCCNVWAPGQSSVVSTKFLQIY